MTIYRRLERLEERINEDDFTIPKGIGSEIPHFVFDYPAEDELTVRIYMESLLRRTSLNIKEINLFEFFISLFEEDLEELIIIAEEEGYVEFSQAIQTVLEDQDLLVNSFIEKANNTELIFITGVGTVHPFIRSSQLLKKLSNNAFKTPLVLFYPGYFSGVDLRLFNKFRHEDEYQITRIS
ncbi:BREX protein BrxB domain-containing protein [Exiguobacterium undae]|uniref:BREX protein BrxB domain-containing protein n=1 Tax=Exiguobacterium undae TaxID=169177 RepID=UPI000478AD0E|nr:BREX protein BrxB domain-containing protein [Exiguobacterium undae]